MRQNLRMKQYNAACLIQQMARRKLRKIKLIKNLAASRIQKNWRRLKFIWLALLRCIYQQPIPELHKAAMIIQKKYRHWKVFKNSPLAQRYNKGMDVLIAAVNKIIEWWRPLYLILVDKRRQRQKVHAAVMIQKHWRGWYLRQMLRPDLRDQLMELGKNVTKHKYVVIYIAEKSCFEFMQHMCCSEPGSAIYREKFKQKKSRRKTAPVRDFSLCGAGSGSGRTRTCGSRMARLCFCLLLRETSGHAILFQKCIGRVVSYVQRGSSNSFRCLYLFEIV